ncbi:transposase [Desulfonema ishimotonii]|uniref:transposase n=1 Tax=Desulfonema ishimotonii TaxID=45657 RepID=UPI0022B0FDF1|nr:transposase [Desulfonema ishimotonii]
MNNVAIDALPGHAKSYEVDLATAHLANYKKIKDLLIFDRNYPSYFFLAFLIHSGISFLGRCSRSSFKEAREMFGRQMIQSRTVTLKPHHTKRKQIGKAGLPMKIRVRFVSVLLETGEVGVLVTSLCDEKLWPTEIFKELYNTRWGVETFYGTLKERLNLENFTGKTVESVRQDFYSTVFISGIESVLTGEARKKLSDKDDKNEYHQLVNKAVSFNTIKNHVTDLFFGESDTEILLEKLTRLFMTNPVCERKNRKFPRKRRPRASLNYHKRFKKIVF